MTQDALVEGVHFRLDWITWRELGFRAAAVNLSDLAAAGAAPTRSLVTLGAPGETQLADVLELYEGLAEPGVPIVGGDTTRADSLVISVTAVGRSERVPGRGGARPGDLLVVTGPLGASGAAFRRGLTPARRSGSRRGGASPLTRTRCSTSRTASRATPRTSPPARAVESSSTSIACRSRPAPSVDDLAFGEDYELLAAVEEPPANSPSSAAARRGRA